MDPELLGCDKVVLLCEGLDTLAEIKINDRFVACTDNMHRTYEFEVKDLLHEGQNNIHVILNSPIRYIEEKHKELPLWGTTDAMEGFPHLRKGHSMFGWDWGPQLPDLGIWSSISLKGYSQGRLEDVYITQNHDKGKVSLDIRVRNNKWGNESLHIEVNITAPDGSKILKTVPVSGIEEHIDVEIENPQLWWPSGYGSQPLYGVDVPFTG